MHVKSFITHKRGQTNDSIQDSISYNIDVGRFALSDGVTDSVLPEIWADVLTSSFVNNEGLSSFPSEESLQIYQSRKDSYLSTLDKEARYIQKLIEKHFYTGAATFIGIELRDKQLKWQVIGDSCLFLLHTGKELQCICSNPVYTNAQGDLEVVFDNYPMQIHSDGSLHGEWTMGQCTFSSGYIVMMSDAMSAWFISQYNLGNNPISQLEKLNDNIDFEEFVEKEVSNDSLASDDESVILIKVDESEISELEENKEIPNKIDDNVLLEQDRIHSSFIEDNDNESEICKAETPKSNFIDWILIKLRNFIDWILIKLRIKKK